MKVLLCRSTLIAMIFALRVFASACPTTTLDAYLAMSFTCMINDEPVANFTFSSMGYMPLPPTMIEVTPTFTASSYTFTFSSVPMNGFSVPDGQSVQYQLNFTWDDPVVVRAEDGVDPPVPVPPGFASLNTDLCLGALFSGSSCSGTPAMLSVMDTGVGSTLTDDTTFSPVGIVDTQSTLILNAISGGSSQITNFSESVFTPEPTGLVLAASGFLAVLLSRRRPLL